jgi:hypothetical protein
LADFWASRRSFNATLAQGLISFDSIGHVIRLYLSLNVTPVSPVRTGLPPSSFNGRWQAVWQRAIMTI